MPTALIELPVKTEPPRKRWTREEYESLPEAVLGYEHLELVEGQLISKRGKNRPHVTALVLLQNWLIQVFGFLFVNPEAPIDVAPEENPTNEPEPNLIVTSKGLLEFDNNPSPLEVLLAVEIANRTLAYDLTTKAGLYARAGIADYWVLDVPGRRIIAHRDPQQGHYRSVAIYTEHESIAPLAAPHAELLIENIFPAKVRPTSDELEENQNTPNQNL